MLNPISIPVVTLRGALCCALNAKLTLIAAGLTENVSDMKEDSFPLLNCLCQRKSHFCSSMAERYTRSYRNSSKIEQIGKLAKVTVKFNVREQENWRLDVKIVCKSLWWRVNCFYNHVMCIFRGP